MLFTTPSTIAKGLTNLSAPSSSSSGPCKVSSYRLSSAARSSSRQSEAFAKHLERVRSATKAGSGAIQRRAKPLNTPSPSPRSLSQSSRTLSSSQSVHSVLSQEPTGVDQVAEALSSLSLSSPDGPRRLPGSRIPVRSAARQLPTTTRPALRSCLAKKKVVSGLPLPRRRAKQVKFSNANQPTVVTFLIDHAFKEPVANGRLVGTPEGWKRLDALESTVKAKDKKGTWDYRALTEVDCTACRAFTARGGFLYPEGSEDIDIEHISIFPRCEECAWRWEVPAERNMCWYVVRRGSAAAQPSVEAKSDCVSGALGRRLRGLPESEWLAPLEEEDEGEEELEEEAVEVEDGEAIEADDIASETLMSPETIACADDEYDFDNDPEIF